MRRSFAQRTGTNEKEDPRKKNDGERRSAPRLAFILSAAYRSPSATSMRFWFSSAAHSLGTSDCTSTEAGRADAVVLPLGIGTAILSEASLGFLGLGVPPPSPTWGRIVGGCDYMRTPWAVASAGIAISLVVLALNLVSDGVRDGLDPQAGSE